MSRYRMPIRIASVSRLAAVSGMLLGALLLAACETRPQIHTQAAPEVNLATYRTFGYMAKLSTDPHGYKTLTTKALETAVSREMQARGYTFSDNPDLIINFSVSSKDKVEGGFGPAFGFGYGPPPGFWGWGWGWGAGGGYDDVRTITEGTLMVDVVDHARNELVWRGSAVGQVTNRDLDNPRPTIEISVADMFKRYPVPPVGAPGGQPK